MDDQTSTQARARAARMVMAGFDDMPRDLRLFLHEYANMIPTVQVDMIATQLRAGRTIDVQMPSGRRYTLRPG